VCWPRNQTIRFVFVHPEEEEEKAKLASPETILTTILHIFNPKDLKEKKF